MVELNYFNDELEEAPVCVCCGKRPEDIVEYREAADEEEYDSATEYVVNEEGTFNDAQNIFCCTECYIKLGCPVGVAKRSWAL